MTREEFTSQMVKAGYIEGRDTEFAIDILEMSGLAPWTKRPAYNHTRGDSALTPCPECAPPASPAPEPEAWDTVEASRLFKAWAELSKFPIASDDRWFAVARKAGEIAAERYGPELERLRGELALAIAHDRQPYPTAHAYEQVCSALEAERKIVGRVWKALGITTYEGANGKSIDELVAEQKAALDAPQPAPAPPISRERLAAELLASTMTFFSADEWEARIRKNPEDFDHSLMKADRAIQLLAGTNRQAHTDLLNGFQESLRTIDELTRERDEARAEAERLRPLVADCEREHPPEPAYTEWVKAEKPIAAYGAAALPPIPEGDAGPKALRVAYCGGCEPSDWMHLSGTTRESWGDVWHAAVALLRPAAATPAAAAPSQERIAARQAEYIEQLQPQLDALKASSKVTAADLATRVNEPVEPRDFRHAKGAGR